MVMETMMKINSMLNDQTALDHRRIVLDVHVGGTNSQIEKVSEGVSGLFDQLGAILKPSNILTQAYLEAHSKKTEKAWIALKKYVKEQEVKRSDPEFRIYFKWIGELAVDYWNKNHPNNPLKVIKL